MKTTHDILRERLLAPVERAEAEANVKPLDIAELRRTQWDDEFEVAMAIAIVLVPRRSADRVLFNGGYDNFTKLMRNRLVVGAFRYGPLSEQPNAAYDVVGYMRTKLKRYFDTGNLEALVDFANLGMVESVKGENRNRPYSAGGYDGKRKIKCGPRAAEALLSLYETSGARMYLAMAAAWACVEFHYSTHPDKHFAALDDTTEHSPLKQ